MALDEDFAELLLDFALLLDRSSPPSAELRAGSAEDDERAELLDFALELDFAELLDLAELLEATLDDERTLLLDRSPDEPGMTEEEESSTGRTKLLSSSQAATKNTRANPSKNASYRKSSYVTLYI